MSQNNIRRIECFSYFTAELTFLSFDSNLISFIAYDAFLNLRSLKHLSISNNKLTQIKANTFFYLFSLKYLNLSQNELESFEEKSFQNLNKLETLDLSFNRFKMIQSNLFRGLENLKDLHLLLNQNQFGLQLNNQSLLHLTNIGNIYVNESTIKEFKCIFMHSMERKIQREISKKYLFFKSINLLNLNVNNRLYDNECQMKFQFIQFKIHFNLKTDVENEMFYEKCQKVLINIENRFRNSENNCLRNHFISSIIDDQDETETNKVVLVFSNGVCLITIFLLLIYLGLVNFLLINHLFNLN